MSHLKDNIAWSRFIHMQHRARGIPLPNVNALQAENRRLQDLCGQQLSLLVTERQNFQTAIKQRDEYASLWMEAKGGA